MNSKTVPQVQAVFPPGALTKAIKVGLQVCSNYTIHCGSFVACRNYFLHFETNCICDEGSGRAVNIYLCILPDLG